MTAYYMPKPSKEEPYQRIQRHPEWIVKQSDTEWFWSIKTRVKPCFGGEEYGWCKSRHGARRIVRRKILASRGWYRGKCQREFAVVPARDQSRYRTPPPVAANANQGE